MTSTTFSNQLKPDDTKIQWKGNIYEPLPIIATGYEKSTAGQIEQPSLTVANVLGTFSELIKDYEDMVGAKVTRRRTLGKYLDGEAGADSLQEFPIDIYYIERKSQENALTITWELASILDLEGLKLPRRIITQNLCLWRYRSSECGYTGRSVIYGQRRAAKHEWPVCISYHSYKYFCCKRKALRRARDYKASS
jgi:lambda family phage minor tail protein L